MNLAATLFRMTPTECLLGVTAHAARALGLGGRKGRLAEGFDADLVVWDAEAPAELSYWIGGRLARTVVAAGRVIEASSTA
jgi:imidazolonepropionase